MPLGLLLAWAAGGVDAIGWLTLDELFTAHMSGNTVSLTVHVALGDWSEVARRAFVIAAFLAGLTVGAAAGSVAPTRGRAGPRSLVALAIEAGLLLGFLIGARPPHAQGSPLHAGIAYFGPVALVATAMGIQSAALRRIGPARARTTFVTGVLANIAEKSVKLVAQEWDRMRNGTDAARGAARRATRNTLALLAAVWTVYAIGGVVSGLLERAIGPRAMALPLTAVVSAIVLGACHG